MNPIFYASRPPPPPRECIVVDGRRYCRDEDMSQREAGLFVLATVLALAWLGWPIYDSSERDLFRWTLARTCAWYFGPPLLLAAWLLT